MFSSNPRHGNKYKISDFSFNHCCYTWALFHYSVIQCLHLQQWQWFLKHCPGFQTLAASLFSRHLAVFLMFQLTLVNP